MQQSTNRFEVFVIAVKLAPFYGFATGNVKVRKLSMM